MSADRAELLTDLIAMLKAVQALHLSAHWQSEGPNGEAYSNHLLFERLYGGLADEIDALAEKTVQLHGVDTVDAIKLSGKVTDWLTRWKDALPIVRGFKAEVELQTALKKVVALDNPLGLDNHLRSIADNHETHLYLLQQSDQ